MLMWFSAPSFHLSSLAFSPLNYSASLSFAALPTMNPLNSCSALGSFYCPLFLGDCPAHQQQTLCWQVWLLDFTSFGLSPYSTDISNHKLDFSIGMSHYHPKSNTPKTEPISTPFPSENQLSPAFPSIRYSLIQSGSEISCVLDFSAPQSTR